MNGWMKRIVLFLMMGLPSFAVGVTKNEYCDAVRAQLEVSDEAAGVLYEDIRSVWGDEQDIAPHNQKLKKITNDLRAVSKVYDIKFPTLYMALLTAQQEAAAKSKLENDNKDDDNGENNVIDDNKVCDDSITPCGVCLKERPKREMVRNSLCDHYGCFFHWLRLYCYDEKKAKCPQCRAPLGKALITILTKRPWVYNNVKKAVERKSRAARAAMIAADEEIAWRVLFEDNPREAARMQRDIRSWRERIERSRRERAARMQQENDARFAHYRRYWDARGRR